MSNPEPKGMLLSEEEIINASKGIVSDQQGYLSVRKAVAKAQHLKTAKAVFEELEKNISASIYSVEAGENVHCISAYMWLKIKKQFGLEV